MVSLSYIIATTTSSSCTDVSSIHVAIQITTIVLAEMCSPQGNVTWTRVASVMHLSCAVKYEIPFTELAYLMIVGSF